MARPTAPTTPWPVRGLCHFALAFGLVFATPVFIALHNVGDLGLDPRQVAVDAATAALLFTFLGTVLAGLAPPRLRSVLDRAALALALLLAAWGNIVHELHDFKVFDGRAVDFRHSDALFWLESLAWVACGVLFYRLAARRPRIPAWLPALPILSFTLLLAPAVLRPPQAGMEPARAEPVDASVYAFSSLHNLLHLLPDGFQGDTVRQVLEDDPELAARFDGFTLYTDHLGRYPGTAPSLYTMLTGRAFPLERGFSYDRVGRETRAESYPAELARHGFQVDLVPISPYICPPEANSCHPRPFKNDGLAADAGRGRARAVRLLADLSLFRLAPVFLKEQIYDRGYWLLSDIGAGDEAPVPDPVLREWSDRLHVVDDRPVYKWYHYVGTHVPPRWDAGCTLRRGLERTPANYRAQARCVLGGMADLFERLDRAGVWDRTAVLVSGDHGHNTVPVDQVSLPLNHGMYEPLLGTGRPALLVKPAGARGPLAFSDRPTQLLDIQPTALALAGLPAGGGSVFDPDPDAAAERVFRHYPIDAFWSGEPVPYLEYAVTAPARDAGHWRLADMVGYPSAPASYRPVNKATAQGRVLGAQLRSTPGHTASSWVRGRQLAFLIDIPQESGPAVLDLEFAFEPWMASQSFSVRVNGGEAWRSGPLGPADGEFRTWSVPVAMAQDREGPDFVSVLFEALYANPDDPGSQAAARVRDVAARRAD